MRLIILALLALLVGVLPVGARGLAAPSQTYFYCSFGPNAGDGCTSAPAPTKAYWCPSGLSSPGHAFDPGQYVATVTGNDVSGYQTNRLPISVPGIDYCIGPYSPLWTLLDPATPNLIPGCTYSTSTSGGHTGGGQLTCGGTSFAGTVQHLNLGPIGGHGCTGLSVGTGISGSTYLIDDIYGYNDSGKCSTSSIGGYPFFLLNMGVNDITISNVFLDGNWITYRAGGVPGCPLCSPMAAIGFGSQSGRGIIKYSAFNHMAGRTLSSGILNGFSVAMTGVAVDGWVSSSLNGHTEFWLGPGSGSFMGDWSMTDSLILQETGASNFGPAPIFMATNLPVGFGNWSLTNTTDINAFIGHGSQSFVFSGCLGGSIDSTGACQTIGNNFYLTHVTSGTFGPMSIMLCTKETATIAGTIVNGDSIKVTFTSSAVTGSPITITVPVTGASTTTTLATTLAADINAVSNLTAAGVVAMAAGTVVTINQRATLSPQITYSRTNGTNATVTLAAVSDTFSPFQQTGGPGPGYLAVYSYDGSTLQTPAATELCSVANYTAFAHIANGALGSFGTGGPMPSVTMTNNQFDVASQIGYPAGAPYVYSFGGGSHTSGAVTGTMTGTTTMTTSASITIYAGEFIYNPAFGGSCTTSDYGGCPTNTITTTGTSFTLSAPKTMSASTFTIADVLTCGVPAVVSGNTDMTNLLPAGYLDSGAPNGAFIHGC